MDSSHAPGHAVNLRLFQFRCAPNRCERTGDVKSEARRDSKPGDFVRRETRRGAVEVKVRSDRDVPENMVFMPFCYAEAAANLLTNPALDPFGKIPEFKFCAVRAERAEVRTAAE